MKKIAKKLNMSSKNNQNLINDKSIAQKEFEANRLKEIELIKKRIANRGGR